MTIIAATFILSSCAVQKFKDDVELSDLGRDAELVYYQDSETTYIVMGQNQSRSFEHGSGTVRHGIWARLAAIVSGDITGSIDTDTLTQGATDQLGITTQGATEQLAIETDGAVRMAEIALEGELAP